MTAKRTFDEIRGLTKPQIINIGIERIRQHLDFASANHLIFDKISVWTNDQSIRVECSNPIKFIPFNSEFFYDVTIDLIPETIWYDVFSNPHGYSSGLHTPFFIPTAESEKIIQFVTDAINRNAGLPISEHKTSFLKDFNDSLIIRDKKNHYAINRTSPYQESWYSIDKITGELYDEGHAHLEPPPDEDEAKRFIEILS